MKMKNTSRIIKKTKSGNFSIILNDISQSRILSSDSIYLIINMLSRPDGWVFRKSSYHKQTQLGSHRFRNAWNQLTELGYIKCEPIKDGNLTIGFNYEIYDVPMSSVSFSVNTNTVYTNTVSTDTVRLSNTEDIKKEDIKKEDIKQKEKLKEKDIDTDLLFSKKPTHSNSAIIEKILDKITDANIEIKEYKIALDDFESVGSIDKVSEILGWDDSVKNNWIRQINNIYDIKMNY